jgi:hypothetical protein
MIPSAKVIDPDEYRKDDNFRYNTEAKVYAEYLNELKNYDVVRLVGGGSASGKSEVIVPELIKLGGLILDTTLAKYESAKRAIDDVLSAGKKVEIHAVFTDLEIAAKFNTARDREVPLATLKKRHTDFRQTISRLAEEYQEIPIFIYLNTEDGVQEIKFPERRDLIEFLAKMQ